MNRERCVDFFIQARMSSKRLPEKVLLDLMGHPVLHHVCGRAKKSLYVRNLVVLTSSNSDDDRIESSCQSIGILCFRGALDDVLDRYYQAACHYKSEHIVRITADCPCVDAGLIDQLLDFYFENNFDYASTAAEPTFPDGLDVEVFSFKTLEKMWREAKLLFQREHVTQYAFQNPELFKKGSFKSTVDNSHFRITLDTPDDFLLIKEIYRQLYNPIKDFSYTEVIKLLQSDPNLSGLNQHLKRNSSLDEQMKKELKNG